MISAPPPYVLEDRTGLLTGSDFDDIYDRIFLRVAQPPQPTEQATLMIYNMGRRSSPRHRDSRHIERSPYVVLEFGPNGTLGNILFKHLPEKVSVPMHKYLRKTTIFGGPLSRKFRASDGAEYRWLFRGVQGQEWSCLTAENYVVAHYDLNPTDRPAYGFSGNVFTIHESFTHLAVEFLASLTVMRHIAHHNL